MPALRAFAIGVLVGFTIGPRAVAYLERKVDAARLATLQMKP